MRPADTEGAGSAGGSAGPTAVGSGLALAGLVAAMAWIPGARATPLPSLGIWAGAFGAYAAALALHRRRPFPRAAIWGVALLARVLLLPADPHFSDDIYRYLWDGWVGLHGVNPYAHAPADAALAGLRTEWHALINHPGIRTIYPPGSQWIFLLLATVGPSVLLFKAAWVAADLGVGAVLERLDGTGRTPSRDAPSPRERGRGGAERGSAAALAYLWCPLVLVEVAWSGHLEPVGALPMMAALLLLEPRPERSRAAGGERLRSAAAGILLGLGASVKLAPAAALPALWRRRGLAAAALLLALPALLALPLLDAGPRLLSGLAEYAERWSFAPGPFRAVELLPGDPRAARLAAAAGAGGVALLAAARRWEVRRALYWTLGSALLLSPTLHPWYLLWILPLAALRGGRAWLLLSGLVFLAYAGRDVYAATGVWPLPDALAALIWIPFLYVLVSEAAGTAARPAGADAGRRDSPAVTR